MPAFTIAIDLSSCCTEKFNEALSDYEKAIEIKQSVLEDDNRELAEAHYKYALALEFSTEKADQALPELQKAVNVLKKRISNLEAGEGKGKGKGKATDLDEKAVKEIKEINELIPDMELKVSLIRLLFMPAKLMICIDRRTRH